MAQIKEKNKEVTGEKDRDRELSLAIEGIEKQFGKGSIMRLTESEVIMESIAFIPSGSFSLDMSLGIGGYPRGRIVEIFGSESSGKTTLALHAIAEAQKTGGLAVFIDAEHALDVKYAKRLGIKTEDLLISQPDTGEQALEIAENLIRSNAVDIMVIDSVAALVPKAELEGDMGDSFMGLQARLMSQAMRKLTGAVSKSRTCLVFINQTRMKIGVFFGNPETTTGGNALKFYASQRLDVRRIGSVKWNEQENNGIRVRVKVVKNKLAAPFREAEFDILYGEGINREGDIMDIAVEENIIEKSGAWYSFEGERLGNGRENAVKLLKENKDLLAAIEGKIKAKHMK
jgi:recombination protein RecA